MTRRQIEGRERDEITARKNVMHHRDSPRMQRRAARAETLVEVCVPRRTREPACAASRYAARYFFSERMYSPSTPWMRMATSFSGGTSR